MNFFIRAEGANLLVPIVNVFIIPAQIFGYAYLITLAVKMAWG